MTDITIQDQNTLREHFGKPIPVAVACIRKKLDKFQRLFIEHSPFACLASADVEGQPTISPKGDAPGFIEILNDSTLILPDRIGNNKVESFQNILENSKVALIFFIPGIRETLRVAGEAHITTDKDQLAFSQVGKTTARTGLVIKVTKSYFHCGKSMIRSRLWDPKHHIEPGIIPPFSEIIKEEAEIDDPLEAVEAIIDDAYTNKLY